LTAPLLAPRILAGLKDFQLATVEHVFRRMYEDPEPTHRFLVADEVGLGKTLVARGLVAKVIDHLRNQGVPRIDIVYICSNGDIAAQNIRKINVTGDSALDHATRITLVPTRLRQLKERGVNFVSFTPGTSFDLGSGSGRIDERALLYWLLRHSWNSSGMRHAGVMRLLRGGAGEQRFRSTVATFSHRGVGTMPGQIDPDIAELFRKLLAARDVQAAAENRATFHERFDDLAGRLRRKDRTDVGPERNRLVGELRGVLARACVDALEPDVIILDEFQRFRELLEEPSGDADEARTLAHQLFNYESPDGRARTLLLSATPYKMFTLADEKAQDDHYRDFARTTDFLLGHEQAPLFRRELRSFREGLLGIGELPPAALVRRRRAVEKRLRSVMVRTERLGETANRSGMLQSKERAAIEVTPGDVRGFVTFDSVSRRLGAGDSVDYWKSAPYPLAFMDAGYDVKRKLRDADPVARADVAELVKHRAGLLDSEALVGYGELDPGSGRLRTLQADTLGTGTWKLLWMPPSLPYYTLRGPYADPNLGTPTKRLVFSAWAVVPQAVASMLSYEAERRMMRERLPRPVNTPEARQQQRSLLQFRRAKGLPAGMSTFALVYPSSTLALLVDPLALGAEGRPAGGTPSAARILKRATEIVQKALVPVVARYSTDDAPVDDDWYWAAALLLDRERDSRSLTGFFERRERELVAAWMSKDRADDGEDSGAFGTHLMRARDVARGRVMLGTPPSDLAETVALLGLAGPAVVALRAMARGETFTELVDDVAVRDGACRVAWGFRSLFSPPEVMSLIRGRKGTQKAYWRRVLGYAFDGGIQAVLDEFGHVLPEWLGLLDRPAPQRAQAVAEAMYETLSLRAARYGFDAMRLDVPVGGSGGQFRGRFALRFGVDSTDEQAVLQRSGQVRAAFNSPFWPFVLVTTSVGQEGLDFHQYCHAVVHWNLPANPVDLEQREGRVHRYKGHAVRRNVAAAHGREVLTTPAPDPWSAMFQLARLSPKARGKSELVPYWVYPGRHKIERYVPSLPLSREHQRLARLLKSLALYRLVFGQPRQEDLVALLSERLDQHKVARAVRDLRIDLSPPPLPAQAIEDLRSRVAAELLEHAEHDAPQAFSDNGKAAAQRSDIYRASELGLRYQAFFGEILRRTKDLRPELISGKRVGLGNWYQFSAGRPGFAFVWSLAGEARFRVELYIDAGNAEVNQRLLDKLQLHMRELDGVLGETTVWEPLDGKRACRMAVYHSANRGTFETDANLIEWAARTMVRFADAIGPLIQAL
jgi:hypothetical protein